MERLHDVWLLGARFSALLESPTMSVAKLSVSHQNYLRAIWNLGEWSAEPVSTSALAAKVGLRLSTVSDALKKLTEQGLVAHSPYGAIELTEQGRALGRALAERRVEQVQGLAVQPRVAHASGEVVERALPP